MVTYGQERGGDGSQHEAHEEANQETRCAEYMASRDNNAGNHEMRLSRRDVTLCRFATSSADERIAMLRVVIRCARRVER